MQRIILAALCAAALLIPTLASAEDKTPTDANDGLSWCDTMYLDLYEQADSLGYPLGHNAVNAGVDRDQVCRQMNKLDGIVTELSAPAPEPTAGTTATTSTGGTDAIPAYISDCESGGDYGASNPSGAYGKYQIMPDTASAYGCDLSTPAGQDACASEIYADVGSSAWSCG